MAAVMRAFTVLLLLLGLASPATAQDVATVRALLSGVEDAPAAEDFEGLGEGTVPVLIRLYEDSHEERIVRTRAVWAARFYATDASRAFLERVVHTDSLGLVVRTAAESLAFAFGASATPVIVPLLRHGDPAVREGAIQCLGRIGGEDARRALAAHRDTDPALRTLTERTLGALR